VTREALESALTRAAEIWTDKKEWRRLQTNGMAMDVGWDRAAGQYAKLYRDLIKARNGEAAEAASA
jgi:starch synthase